MEHNKRVTIKELSKILGVSTTTITNALTGQPNVSEKRRNEIIEKAKELGYRPNQYARAMVRNGFKIGVVISEEPHEFLKYLKRGIEEGIEALTDYKVEGIFETYSNHNAYKEFKAALLKVLSENVNGLILGLPFAVKDYAEVLKEIYETKKIPIILLHRDLEGEVFSGLLAPDNEAIGSMAAEIIALTHPKGTKVAAITTRKEFVPHSISVAAFEKSCAKLGLKLCCVYENSDNKQTTYELTERILLENPDCRVIYVTSFDSVSACRCIRNMGLEKKVRVISHDIYPEMTKYMESGIILASMYQNPINMGKSAVHKLFEHFTVDTKESGRIYVRPEVILRSNMYSFPEALD